MEQIIKYIQQKYDPLSIILYGSYANGTNNFNSDFDALVISSEHKCHDTSFVGDVQLDVFVYSVSYFDEKFNCEEFIQIFDGRIIKDTNDIAKTVQAKVLEYLQNRPHKTSEELRADIAWCEKMLKRAKRQDAEGMFRGHWVVIDSLEIFCDIMQQPYFGPKKSLKWLEEKQPEAFDCYDKALRDFGMESLENWILYLKRQGYRMIDSADNT